MDRQGFDYRNYIESVPERCHGAPTLSGTRVLLRTVLAYLADGHCAESIRADFPSLTDEHIRAAVVFAAKAASDEFPLHVPADHAIQD